MTDTSLDFSSIDELKPLARLIDRIRSASEEKIEFFIAGAQARDLLLYHAHGIDPRRRTADVDFAFRVSSWEEFHRLREGLLSSGDFTPVAGKQHKVKYRDTLEVDIVPFGPIESPDRTIAWPPDHDFVMSAFGFREAADATVDVRLPESVSVRIVSLPALALLKLEAWRERRRREPGKDAHDIRVILENYLDAGHRDRLYSEFETLLQSGDFDYVQSGALILGQDMRRIVDERAYRHLDQILVAEADPEGELRLVSDMRMEPAQGLALLGAWHRGLNASG